MQMKSGVNSAGCSCTIRWRRRTIHSWCTRSLTAIMVLAGCVTGLVHHPVYYCSNEHLRGRNTSPPFYFAAISSSRDLHKLCRNMVTPSRAQGGGGESNHVIVSLSAVGLGKGANMNYQNKGIRAGGVDLNLDVENEKQQLLPISPVDDEEGLSKQNNLLSVMSSSNGSHGLTQLNLAFEEAERITRMYSKTFYLGTRLVRNPDKQKALWAIYAWCRRIDGIVDGPRATYRGGKLLSYDLRDCLLRLEEAWRGQPRDMLNMALAHIRTSYPTLSIQPFKDMIAGMVMDDPVMGKCRYSTFSELEEYCYCVAGTVGLMTLPIFGTAPGVSEDQAKGAALNLGVAMQLTNILRDVGEDAERGRIYLPQEDLVRFHVPESHILNGILSDNYVKLMKFMIARARHYYDCARIGMPLLSSEARFPVQASLDLYSQILNSLEKNYYDNFRKRAFISMKDRFMRLPWILWDTFNLKQAAQDAKYRIVVNERDGVGFKACATRFDLLTQRNKLETVLGVRGDD